MATYLHGTEIENEAGHIQYSNTDNDTNHNHTSSNRLPPITVVCSGLMFIAAHVTMVTAPCSKEALLSFISGADVDDNMLAMHRSRGQNCQEQVQHKHTLMSQYNNKCFLT